MQQRLAFLPINQKLEWLKDHNEEHSRMFCSPDQQLARRLYRAQHPTRIAAFKCMDGRINLPIVTKMPLGIIDPFRNLAGKFDLGWPYLGDLFQEWVNSAINSGHRCLVLATYHYSAGDDQHRGCAGFDYDKERAVRSTMKFKRQIERVFGVDHQIVYPITVGLETDSDVLVFHGNNGMVFDLTRVTDRSESYITSELSRLYPDMPERIRTDLVPLIQGNIDHIHEIALSRRPIVEAHHREWVLGIGRGFDWLHEPNLALLVGPYSPNLEVPITKALSIMKSNMQAKRISDDGFVLLTSSPHVNSGSDKQRAREKALFLSQFARDVVEKNFPELLPIMREMVVTLDTNTRRFEAVPSLD